MERFADLLEWVDGKFLISERKSNITQELRAGTSTFLTMSYILLVNPQMLAQIGIPATSVVVSTALASFSGSFITGYFGNMPFGLAPGIGLSTYLTYGLVLGSGLTVAEAFTSCFIAGILLLVLSVSGLSSQVMKLIPRSVKFATIVGMGLLIAIVGMTSIKLVVPNDETIVGLGNVYSSEIILSIVGLVLIGSLLLHRVRGGILIGILIMTMVDWSMRGHFPAQIVQAPDLYINVSNFINFSSIRLDKCISGILSFVFIGIIDVSGIVFGMASLAGIIEPDGRIPGATPTFIAVALSTLISAITGGTPVIVYVESAAGIKEGGKTGLTALLISFYFLLSLFFAPVLSEIPLIATAPVSILVGAMMMSQAVEIDWNTMSEAIPAFLTLITMPFTFSITNGIVLGLISGFLFYLTTGQAYADVKELYYGNPKILKSDVDGSASSEEDSANIDTVSALGGLRRSSDEGESEPSELEMIESGGMRLLRGGPSQYSSVTQKAQSPSDEMHIQMAEIPQRANSGANHLWFMDKPCAVLYLKPASSKRR